MNEAPDRIVRRSLLLAWATLPLVDAWAQAPAGDAQRFTRAETEALRATVQAQLDALAAGDAARAYGLASAAIQRQFGDAARFIAMVQSAYPMLLKPARVAYLLPERSARAVVQPVHVHDRAGQVWLATYQMEAQPGGGWRIAGCVVVASPRRVST